MDARKRLGVQKRDVEHSEGGEKGMIMGYILEVEPKECADGGGWAGREGTRSTVPEYVT